MQEAQQNTIDLQDDDSDVVYAMMRFMYTGNFDNSGSEDVGQTWGMFCIAVHAIADKYNVAFLGDLAAESLEQWSSDFWKEQVFTEVVREVYTNKTDRDGRLRDAVLSVAAKHVQSLFAYRHHAGFRAMAEALPGFVMTLASELATRVTNSDCPPSTASDSARQVYMAIRDSARGKEGVSEEEIATITGLEVEEVPAAAQELEYEAFIRSAGNGWRMPRPDGWGSPS
ncbi:hypothetical protein LTR85_002363 [Meristemomyces frigidus]|nr:hypothetical protein LTR85_002363 [Meristemomyces frigidus]